MRYAWYRCIQVAAQVLFIGAFGYRAYHRHRLPNMGGVLVVSNHQSYLDPILSALGATRPFNPMARASLFRNWAFSWLIRSLFAFPVKRATGDLGAIREALRRLRQGKIVLVFPEGTRTSDGSIGQIQEGVVAIASRAGVPIVPMVVNGAFEAWPRDRSLPRFLPINVAYGRPISAATVAQGPREQIAAEIHEQMCALQNEVRKRRARWY